MSTLAQSDVFDSTAFTRPAVNPWLIAFTVMLATFMEVLDTSIANVALPHIDGNLSAGVGWWAAASGFSLCPST